MIEIKDIEQFVYDAFNNDKSHITNEIKLLFDVDLIEVSGKNLRTLKNTYGERDVMIATLQSLSNSKTLLESFKETKNTTGTLNPAFRLVTTFSERYLPTATHLLLFELVLAVELVKLAKEYGTSHKVYFPQVRSHTVRSQLAIITNPIVMDYLKKNEDYLWAIHSENIHAVNLHEIFAYIRDINITPLSSLSLNDKTVYTRYRNSFINRLYTSEFTSAFEKSGLSPSFFQMIFLDATLDINDFNYLKKMYLDTTKKAGTTLLISSYKVGMSGKYAYSMCGKEFTFNYKFDKNKNNYNLELLNARISLAKHFLFDANGRRMKFGIELLSTLLLVRELHEDNSIL